MMKSIIRLTSFILLIASVSMFNVGCGTGSNKASTTNTTANKNAIQIPAEYVLLSSKKNKTEYVELSNYLLCNVDLVHDDLGGKRVGTSEVKQYMVSKPGDIFVVYSNRADEGMYVVSMSMFFSGNYRAGGSTYTMFGCKLGDTSSDVRYRLQDYGFKHSHSSDGYEYLDIYDGEWKLSYKCDNGFLSEMTVSCKRRSAGQAVQSGLVSGYYVAALKGYATKTAYIEKIFVADNHKSIAFRGVFEMGPYEGAKRQLTGYTTFTVFPDKNTVYVGGDQYYSEDEFIRIIQSFNGLGLALTVDNGTLVKAELLS